MYVEIYFKDEYVLKRKEDFSRDRHLDVETKEVEKQCQPKIFCLEIGAFLSFITSDRLA